MKVIFDTLSFCIARLVTRSYSTSFSMAVRLLSPSIRQDIYNIYGFVRCADEIVDSFHGYDKEKLFSMYELALEDALKNRISLNPILNAFQHTVHKYGITEELITAFMKSMRLDLVKKKYTTFGEYNDYIYGIADVVGLMCLRVFVKDDSDRYENLKGYAMKLGSAFQKVNFLRDIKADSEDLGRWYFPSLIFNSIDSDDRSAIVRDIESDLAEGYKGIRCLPREAKFGVYIAYLYYKALLARLKKVPLPELMNSRVRIPTYQKLGLLARCCPAYHLKII